MKSPIVVAGVTAFLSLNACGDGSLDFGRIGGFPDVPPVTLSVDAGPDQNVVEGDSVTLQGNVTAALNCYANFEWSQIAGPDVFIFGPGNSKIVIATPSATSGSPLTFELKATCRDSSSSIDTVSVFVEPTSASALCLQAPAFTTTYAWTNSGCTTDSADIVGDTRVATIYRLEEAEPNDSHDAANPITFPARITAERVGTDVAAFVSGMGGVVVPDFEDFFVLTPPETGVYEIFLCNDPLICIRGTVSDKWVLELRNQNFDPFASTHRGEVKELRLQVQLEAGLPYYLWVHVFESSWTTWDYNLTILSATN